MSVTCSGCGAPLENRGSGHFKCTYCGTQSYDATVGHIETNQAISASMGMIARKAAKEELRAINQEIAQIKQEIAIAEQSIATLSSGIYDNDKKRVAPWRIWSFLIGVGSFFLWDPLVDSILIRPSFSSDSAKLIVYACAFILAFSSGQIYRRYIIYKRSRVIAENSDRLQDELEVSQRENRRLVARHRALLVQLGETKSIAEGWGNRQ